MSKKVVLVILDGWGIGDGSKSDAIANANTPFVDGLYKKYPHSTLRTSGENVGLPDGQMGNSEVGHLNIGAGRVVYQDFARINKEIREKKMDTNPVLLDALNYAKQNKKDLHIMGLVSDGGVHSHQLHLHHLCDMAKANGLNNVYIHAFTDGRDTDPKSGLGFITSLEEHLKTSTGKIASVVGRYYAMDRDKRWERVQQAYNLLVKGEGKKAQNITDAIKASYAENVTDEFIKPIVVTKTDGSPIATIKEGDVVICFNFRTDRCREITTVLTQKDLAEQQMKKMNLYYVTMTNYDDSFKDVKVVYDKDNLHNTLGEIISKADKTQIRIAETEKYPHVTFFFSGGQETEFKGEKRIMVSSPKVATYDLQPEMSAEAVTDAIVAELKTGDVDFVCLNYANADMVGHTGDYKAVTKAVETVDACLKCVVEIGLEKNYSFIIIADHGNADYMINPDGSPNTAHTTNPVPCIIIDKDVKKVTNGKLSDIAPTILKLMSMDIPSEMDGVSLVAS
ncbi:MAG: 2,3-bisphosphoglycerate-independent phosphoglycerate mutase [Bacteroidetes bacterium]|nr:2,3-bisphosphoglycerate-independent phosphoglycerate mutase [Bacteroidota bacterium]